MKESVEVGTEVVPVSVDTIGHSTRSEDEFSQILVAHNVRNLVDVRSFPGSRRYPQFNQQQLAESLPPLGMKYHHLPALGGRRRPLPNSKNTAWKNSSFRAYADYMESEGFRVGIDQLLDIAKVERTAIMCAEALWWRCHRGLIADYLKMLGIEVLHIVDAKRSETHPFSSAAQIIDGTLSYEGLLG
ncbi:MAG: DUF488 domain-containing protein [Pyrinomonadaceae bacterium]